MIAKLAKRGASFKGAGNYYLHDKDAQTSERVAWTETVNLRTHDPERALRVMAGTAMDREAIKEAAGIKASGRSSDKVVQTYSLSWHPDEQPSKAEMLAAARESLKVLGIEDRQALIVCHNDEPIRTAYEKFQASRAATLRQYDQEQQGYRRLWAERNAARREAWRAHQAKYRPQEHERLRHQRQRDNLQRIEDRARQLNSHPPRSRDHGREQ